ncbi:T6SS immunity protein Tdi1 domain-containing protein [Kitasatospora sp. NPDC004289]
MFEQFTAGFAADSSDSPVPFAGGNAPGLAELRTFGAGLSFGNGIVRIHSEESARRSHASVLEMFPQFRGRFEVFAEDWLGRQFAVRTDVEDQLVLFEPGSGEAYEIDAGVVSFVDVDLVEDPETFLAVGLFREWRAANPEVRLLPGQCVGFKVPFFLGGGESVENLEVIDADVYWSLHAQLKAGVAGLQPGTRISGVGIE